jgi:hypothetical protein
MLLHWIRNQTSSSDKKLILPVSFLLKSDFTTRNLTSYKLSQVHVDEKINNATANCFIIEIFEPIVQNSQHEVFFKDFVIFHKPDYYG